MRTSTVIVDKEQQVKLGLLLESEAVQAIVYQKSYCTKTHTWFGVTYVNDVEFDVCLNSDTNQWFSLA